MTQEAKETKEKVNVMVEHIATRSRIVKLEYSFNTNAFLAVNKNYLPNLNPPIGETGRATKAILSNFEELRLVMPHVINTSPDNKDTDFHKAVKYYFNSFDLRIPDGGREMEIGFIYDIDDDTPIRQKHISETMKNYKLNDANDLADWVEGQKNGKDNVEYKYRYRYGRPINPEDYINNRYFDEHVYVANKPEDIVGKSTKIRYFVNDPEAAKKEARKLSGIRTQAMKLLVDCFTDENKTEAMVLNIRGTLSGMDDQSDMHLFLQDYIATSPDKFIEMFTDKTLSTKAEIYLMIDKNILSKVNSLIYETAESSNVIGNDMGEAVAYFNNKKNEDKINKLRHALKTL